MIRLIKTTTFDANRLNEEVWSIINRWVTFSGYLGYYPKDTKKFQGNGIIKHSILFDFFSFGITPSSTCKKYFVDFVYNPDQLPESDYEKLSSFIEKDTYTLEELLKKTDDLLANEAPHSGASVSRLCLQLRKLVASMFLKKTLLPSQEKTLKDKSIHLNLLRGTQTRMLVPLGEYRNAQQIDKDMPTKIVEVLDDKKSNANQRARDKGRVKVSDAIDEAQDKLKFEAIPLSKEDINKNKKK